MAIHGTHGPDDIRIASGHRRFRFGLCVRVILSEMDLLLRYVSQPGVTLATVLAAPRPLLLLCAQGNGSRIVTEDPGRVSRTAQEAVFGGDPLHLADARHA